MSRTIDVPAQTLTEEITTISIIPGARLDLVVNVGSMQSGVFSVERFAGAYTIAGDDYAELMSAGPFWSPNKPAGVYRTEDLWHYVDKYRATAAPHVTNA